MGKLISEGVIFLFIELFLLTHTFSGCGDGEFVELSCNSIYEERGFRIILLMLTLLATQGAHTSYSWEDSELQTLSTSRTEVVSRFDGLMESFLLCKSGVSNVPRWTRPLSKLADSLGAGCWSEWKSSLSLDINSQILFSTKLV